MARAVAFAGEHPLTPQPHSREFAEFPKREGWCFRTVPVHQTSATDRYESAVALSPKECRRGVSTPGAEREDAQPRPYPAFIHPRSRHPQPETTRSTSADSVMRI